MNEETTKALTNLAKMFGSDRVLTSQEIDKVLNGILKMLLENKKETEALNVETKAQVEKLLNKFLDKYAVFVEDMKTLEGDVSDIQSEMLKKVENKISEVTYLLEEAKKINVKEEKLELDDIVQAVMENITLPEVQEMMEISGERIIDLINDTPNTDENKISWFKIKDIPEFFTTPQTKKGKLKEGGMSPTVLRQAVDLDHSTRADGYAIVWDATNNRYTHSASGGGSMEIGGTITSATQGSIFFAGASGVLAQNNTNFFWDNTNNRLGIGTASPATPFHLLGSSGTNGIRLETSGANTPFLSFKNSTGTRSFRAAAGVLTYGTGDNVGFTQQLQINASGQVCIGNTAATHALTFDSTQSSTGIALYNTVDQTTNFERGYVQWSSNIFQIGTTQGGTGTSRVFRVGQGNVPVIDFNTASSPKIQYNAGSSGGTGATTFHNFISTSTASSGTPGLFSISPTINQSSTAGYTALLINPTETTTGSGTKLLADFQVGGSSKMSIDNTGKITTLTTIELGNASDTTLSRSSAGVLAVEGIVVPTISSTDTLSNKTLTAPKIANAGFIADANGNEQIIFTTTASATNEFTIVNGADGSAPQLQATGSSDSNVDISLVPKGTGIVKGTLHRFMVRLVASDTDVATGTSIGGDYRIANRAITVKQVGAYVDTAGVTGDMTIDINEAGNTIMSTDKIKIATTAKTSTTHGTQPALTDTAIAADAIVTIDVDAVQTTKAKGLVVWIDYVYA